LLLGGVPFESPILMWWNFVGRTRAEFERAGADWNRGNDRFGETGSPLERIPAPPTPW
jgi:quercetin 2,3-dioxygenase